MNARKTTLVLLLVLAAGSNSEARADGKLTAMRELAEWALRKFSGKATREGAEALTRRIATAAARHGDDLVTAAVRRAGPKALSLADEAAEQAPRVLRFLGRHGDDGAALLTKQSMRLLSLGDEAAEMLVKHKGVSAPLLESFGNSATHALSTITPRNGRRLAMVKDTLLGTDRADDVLAVVGKYGDRAMEWIWNHKGPLAASAAMAAFVSDPEPFINGARDVTAIMAKDVVVPVTTAVVDGGAKVAAPMVKELSREAARSIPWAPLAILTALMGGALAVFTLWRLLPPRRVSPAAAGSACHDGDGRRGT